jgi:Domain of unknown function (DUF4340)
VRGAPRRRVLIIWLMLAGLVGVIAVLEYADLVSARSGRARNADPGLLVPVPIEEMGALEVAAAGTRHRFERTAAGAWFYHGAHTGAEGAHAHSVDPAVSERIEAALRAFGRTRIERQLARDRDADAYGVTAPSLVVLIYRANESQPLAQYAVGDLAPDTVSRYVDVVGGSGVVTIPGYQIDNLLALIQAVGAAPPPAMR